MASGHGSVDVCTRMSARVSFGSKILNLPLPFPARLSDDVIQIWNMCVLVHVTPTTPVSLSLSLSLTELTRNLSVSSTLLISLSSFILIPIFCPTSKQSVTEWHLHKWRSYICHMYASLGFIPRLASRSFPTFISHPTWSSNNVSFQTFAHELEKNWSSMTCTISNATSMAWNLQHDFF